MRQQGDWHGRVRLVLALVLALVLPSVVAPSLDAGAAPLSHDVAHTNYDTGVVALVRSPSRPLAAPARPRTVEQVLPDAITPPTASHPHNLVDLGQPVAHRAPEPRTEQPPSTRERAPPTH